MDRFLTERSALIATATPGQEAAEALCALTDAAVRDLARAAASHLSEPWSIVALGGWGAGALQPGSDLDILVLSEAPPERLRPFVEAILYPLWDAGLKVGHQVRTPKMQLKATREDLATRTATLTGRHIAGDERVTHATLARCAAQSRKNAGGDLTRLRERPRPGSPFLLEPDLKDGAGGRRDYDELVWTAATLSGCPQRNPSALAELGVLSPDDVARVDAAARVTAAARWRMQRDGGGDRLMLDAASKMGDVAEDLQCALAATALVLERCRRRTGRRRAAPASRERWDAPELLRALSRGGDALSELEAAASAGELDDLLPGFSRLMCVRRPGLGHTLTVGAHSLKCAALLSDLDRTGPLGRSREMVRSVRTLQIAALCHDAGKLEGGAGHAQRGAPYAEDAAHRFGLSADAARDVADLTRHHLLLAQTALHEDLDDEDVILRTAASIARRDLVAPLHLLTAADSLATGPANWSPWTAALVATLVTRLDAALSRDGGGPVLARRAIATRNAAVALWSAGSKDGAEATFIESAPIRYLSSRSASDVVRDAHLVSGLAASAGAERSRISVTPGPVDGTHAITVAATDSPHLLSRLAGAMSLAGLDILSLDAHGVTGRIALDSFVVRSATNRAVTPETFTKLSRLIDAAIADRLALAARLAERRRHYPPTVQITPCVDVRAGSMDTIVTVDAADRPGLLHDLAEAVSATGLDIRWAKAQTVEGVARDTFHVTGPDGGVVDEPGILGHLSMRLRESL